MGDRVLGKMESGTRLQFVQFVHALQCLCDDMVRLKLVADCCRLLQIRLTVIFCLFLLKRCTSPCSQGVGIDAALYRIVGDGSAPPMLQSHGVSRALRTVAIDKVTEMLFETELEQPLR